MATLVLPFDATLYGLPAEADAWKLELDAKDVRKLAGEKWTDLRLVVVGTGRAGGDDVPVTTVISKVIPEDWIQLDILLVEARLDGLSGALRWSWRPGEGERLDLLHIEHMRAYEIDRLRRSRNAIDLARARLGRPPGIVNYPHGEFASKLAEAVRALRKDRSRLFTQVAVADRLGTSVTTLRSNMKRDGINWSAIKVGDWPPR